MDLVTGETTKSGMSAQKLKEIFEENSAEVAKIVRDTDPSLATKTDEEILGEIKTEIDKNYERIENMLPPAEDIVDALEEIADVDGVSVRETVSFIRNSLLPLFIAVVAMLSVAILIGKFYRFKGFLWLGIVYMFTAVILLTVSSSLGQTLATAMPESSAFISIADSFISSVAEKYGAAYALIAVALIVVYIILRLTVVKKKIQFHSPLPFLCILYY